MKKSKKAITLKDLVGLTSGPLYFRIFKKSSIECIAKFTANWGTILNLSLEEQKIGDREVDQFLPVSASQVDVWIKS